MKFRDIVLGRDEVERLKEEVARLGIDPQTDEGQARLKELVDEYKQGIWDNRDYVYGQDEGEPPKGAEW